MTPIMIIAVGFIAGVAIGIVRRPLPAMAIFAITILAAVFVTEQLAPTYNQPAIRFVGLVGIGTLIGFGLTLFLIVRRMRRARRRQQQPRKPKR